MYGEDVKNCANFLGASLAVVLALSGCGSSTAPEVDPTHANAFVEPQASVSPDPEKVAAFNDAIKAEPKVIDFVYDPQAVVRWTIAVKDDGTPRYGYAEYFCVLMAQHDLPLAGAWVRIVDYGKFMQPGGNGRDASLGSVDCGTGEHMMP